MSPSELLVHTVMTERPRCVRPDTPLRDAIAYMEEGRFRHLPVVNADGRLVGIVSPADYAGLAEELIDGPPPAMGQEPGPLRVADVMTSDPVALSPDDTLGLAATLFLSRLFHAAPVVDDGELVGIVTTHDLLRAAFADVLDRLGGDAYGFSRRVGFGVGDRPPLHRLATPPAS